MGAADFEHVKPYFKLKAVLEISTKWAGINIVQQSPLKLHSSYVGYW